MIQIKLLRTNLIFIKQATYEIKLISLAKVSYFSIHTDLVTDAKRSRFWMRDISSKI